MVRGGRGARGARLSLHTAGVVAVVGVMSVPSTWADAKTGAGLFLLNRDFARSVPHVLLLERSDASNHGGTWSMPGGNFDPTLDETLYDTAVREALEELGSVPDVAAALGSLVVDWGEEDENKFTVFFVETTANNGTWRAKLNEEHTASAWFALSDLGDGDVELHPVVRQLTLMSAIEMIGRFAFVEFFA